MARRALIALALAGCIADPRAGLDDDPDAAVGVDARGAVDARVDRPGDASPPADAEASPDAGSTNCAVDVAYFPTEGFERYEPVVAGGAVYGHRRGPDAGVYDVVNYSGLPHRLRSVFVSCRRCNTDRRPIGRSRLVALRARRVRRWLVGGAR